MLGGRKVRSNKGKKRGPYGPRTRKTVRHSSGRKVRSNKGKKRTPYGPRTGKTRSGRRFRGGGKFTGLFGMDDELAELYEKKGCKRNVYKQPEKKGLTGLIDTFYTKSGVKTTKGVATKISPQGSFEKNVTKETGWKLHKIGNKEESLDLKSIEKDQRKDAKPFKSTTNEETRLLITELWCPPDVPRPLNSQQ